MIDLFDLYQSFKGIVNTFQGGWYRPQTDFTQACNDISKNLWIKWTREAEKSTEAKDNLMPFLRSKNMIVNTAGVYGTFDPPKDYGRYATARIIVYNDSCFPDKEIEQGTCENGEFKSAEDIKEEYYDNIQQWPVELIDDQKWGSVNEHKTKKPNLQNPKMRQVDKKFQVTPRKVSVIVLDYYTEPSIATFTYTKAPGDIQTGSGDQIIYDKSNSKPLEWPSTVRNEFLAQLGERYGAFTRDQFIAQFSTQQKMTG
jgi:hypothetical protein